MVVSGNLQFFLICCQIFKLFKIILLCSLVFAGRTGAEEQSTRGEIFMMLFFSMATQAGVSLETSTV